MYIWLSSLFTHNILNHTTFLTPSLKLQRIDLYWEHSVLWIFAKWSASFFIDWHNEVVDMKTEVSNEVLVNLNVRFPICVIPKCYQFEYHSSYYPLGGLMSTILMSQKRHQDKWSPSHHKPLKNNSKILFFFLRKGKPNFILNERYCLLL